ncbi:hypothetical protein FA15DRAFT_670556 [Coprinopsis marcescibilis]|uniref:CHAT domain-containing protein n=1 Tax=Coprinopsis marcescibilis TaxID=230819 RepID=A0A5C3KT21_COPMA|nr:hypothetical protein FA15DRAFT_670556 [Coprinopsis marcescibilis]
MDLRRSHSPLSSPSSPRTPNASPPPPRSPNANLAFLSACQTSAGEEKLSEEAVHLAAGMLAAGYRGVVGTMWSISDRQAPEVARDFYECLLAEGGKGIDASRASYALHHAIQNLRRRSGNSEHSLLTWVPYVHFGV